MRVSISVLKINRIDIHNRQKVMVPINMNSIAVAKNVVDTIILHLPLSEIEDFKKIIVDKYHIISEGFRKDIKYHNPQNLVPLIVYVYLRVHGYQFEKSVLLSVSHLSSADFNDFIVQVRNYVSRSQEL